MQPREIDLIRQCLPEDMPFPYYTDRESAWLAAHLMRGDSSIAALKMGPMAKLLARPALRPLVAACGGAVRHRDVVALAHADRAAGWRHLSLAGRAALDQLWSCDWLDFRLSFGQWGVGEAPSWTQMSRKGGNLVLQLGFPSDHAELMGRYLARNTRKTYECEWHPVRQHGCPTLAWARLDVDLANGTALIEEIQSDWLRFARWSVARRAETAPRSRALRQEKAYEAGLRARYEKLWPRAMLLSALMVLREELGCRRIFLHQPHAGAALKHIFGDLPPRSLYTALPRSFCFDATSEVPEFLGRVRMLRRLARRGEPLFWRLDL